MAVKTLAQRRAAHAWGAVEQARKTGDVGEFADRAKKLPVQILVNGLGQSLAFLRAKGKAPQLEEALTNWMSERLPGNGRLLERIVQGDSNFQRMATAEALAYLQWLVRFAEPYRKED